MKNYEEIEKRKEEIESIFENTESELHKVDGDNAFLGLQILSKYRKKNLLEGADHDIIYSMNIEDAIELNITDEDCTELARLNWMLYEGEGFACFV